MLPLVKNVFKLNPATSNSIVDNYNGFVDKIKNYFFLNHLAKFSNLKRPWDYERLASILGV
tara:strand:- start:58 stop:240 length:183 start_codon:yes stop_codon:yes gene_type:complete